MLSHAWHPRTQRRGQELLRSWLHSKPPIRLFRRRLGPVFAVDLIDTKNENIVSSFKVKKEGEIIKKLGNTNWYSEGLSSVEEKRYSTHTKSRHMVHNTNISDEVDG
jgi:hypothetical protein